MTFIFATHNEGKMKEIRAIFAETGRTILSAAEAGLTFGPEETGHTFTDNAVEKANKCAALLESSKNICVLADDSGLVIDALDGRPGVYSALWLGEDTPYAERNRRTLEMLKDVSGEKRAARFVCVIAAILPDGRTLTAEASIEGRIAREPKGKNGFGYDPIFYVPGYGRTTAELSQDEKNRISHRGQALRAMLEKLAVFI
jgi:XTP/dITP diphosphohydrolase